jgi:hypothetical protein
MRIVATAGRRGTAARSPPYAGKAGGPDNGRREKEYWRMRTSIGKGEQTKPPYPPCTPEQGVVCCFPDAGDDGKPGSGVRAPDKHDRRRARARHAAGHHGPGPTNRRHVVLMSPHRTTGASPCKDLRHRAAFPALALLQSVRRPPGLARLPRERTRILACGIRAPIHRWRPAVDLGRGCPSARAPPVLLGERLCLPTVRGFQISARGIETRSSALSPFRAASGHPR